MTIRTENRIPLTRIQKLIGQRMLESKRTKPCYYMGIEADTTELMDSRHELKKQLGVKITSNAFYIKALGLAVKEFPLMVGSLDADSTSSPQGDSIIIADEINVGFAISAPQGLVVPVIKEADKKTLAEIAVLEKELTDKARSNKLTLDEITGETIGLSNLGVYGIDSFIGIVPPPATTILAVGNTLRTAVPIDGKIIIRKITDLTIAVDARVVPDPYAAKFLARIAELLQNPKHLI
ncbi:MAG: 2-oxo acid dehydrogenase subunit E2 [Sedimentisphaerales bacterium]|nr:2-oxo acid dehydrogenase subunit E2 [Sedimentisphaerales bacterium]